MNPNQITENNPGKENYFKTKTSAELEEKLWVLLCGSNGGGLLANDIIDELEKRKIAADSNSKR